MTLLTQAKLKLMKLPTKKLMNKQLLLLKMLGKLNTLDRKLETKSKSPDHSDQMTTEEATVQDDRIADELCPDEEFHVAIPSDEKSICTVVFYPIKYKLDRLEEFRSKIEDYFSNIKDVIKEVIKLTMGTMSV